VCLLLAVITLAIYNPVNRHPFVNYDDDRYVTENPHVRQGLTADTIAWSLTSTEQANWHPLTWMSHALDVSLFRLNPAGHHFTNVAIHIANAILLFLVLIWATNRLTPSLIVAALFALHPINVESVAWIAERKNVLCTFFFFLTLWAYGWYAKKPGPKRYLAVAGLFMAGLASKPMVITLPFVLLLLDYWPLRRDEQGKTWAQLVLEKIPLFALSAASAIITMHAQQSGGAVRSTTEFTLGARLANAVYAYAMYLWKMIWPAQLAPLYPHPGDSLATWRVGMAVFVLVAITVIVWRFRRDRYLLVGWCFFLGTLVPVIGLVQVGQAAMADRYGYIPSMGAFIAIAFALDEWSQQKKWILIPVAAAVLALAFATYRQIGFWQTNEQLWTHTLAVTQNNFIAEDNLGGALILEGREEEAFPHFEAAARINRKDPMSHSNLGTYYQTHNSFREAVTQYELAVGLTSDPGLLAQTYANLGMAQLAVGDDDGARSSFDQSMRLNPHLYNSWLGIALLARKNGKLQEAIDDLTMSLHWQPTARAFLELGRTYAQQGQFPMALNSYEQALKLAPELTEAQQGYDELRRQAR